eukprot:scaffold81022_cov37-Tisochrysis_lutea.AAC.1
MWFETTVWMLLARKAVVGLPNVVGSSVVCHAQHVVGYCRSPPESHAGPAASSDVRSAFREERGTTHLVLLVIFSFLFIIYHDRNSTDIRGGDRNSTTWETRLHRTW